MKGQWLFSLAVLLQTAYVRAASGVQHVHTDANGYTYAVVTYSEDDIPWHTAHLYWHFAAYPAHEPYWYSTDTGARGDPNSLHHAQGQAATGNVIPQSQMGYE
jgi:hypothetical protein